MAGTTAGQRGADLRRLARGSSLNLAGSFVAASLNLVLPVVITRGLATADAGLFFQATALFTILLNLGTLGADTGVLRSIPRAKALERPRDMPRYVVVALVPSLVFTVLLSVVLVLSAGPLAGLLAEGERQTDMMRAAVWVLAPFLPVAVGYAVVMSTSRGLGSILPLVLGEKIGRNALETGGAALAAALTSSLALIVLAWVAPYAAMLVVIGVWVARRVAAAGSAAADTAAAARPWRELASEFWRFSAPRAASRVFTVALQRFDVLVVGAIRGPEDAALYAAATRFVVLGLMFVQAIQQVMTPRISELLALEEDRRAETIYRTTTAWLTLVSWPVYLVAMLFAPLLLDVFGPGFDRAWPAAVILCAAMLVATSCGPVDSVLLMGGRSMLSLMNTGTALTVNVGLDLVLVPAWGVTGAAVGWAAGILVNNLLPLWQVRRHLDMHPFGSGTLAAMACCVAAYGVVAGAGRLLLGGGLLGLLVSGLVGTAVFGALVVRQREALELAALRGALRRRGRGRA